MFKVNPVSSISKYFDFKAKNVKNNSSNNHYFDISELIVNSVDGVSFLLDGIISYNSIETIARNKIVDVVKSICSKISSESFLNKKFIEERITISLETFVKASVQCEIISIKRLNGKFSLKI